MSDYKKEKNLKKRLIKIISDAGFNPKKVIYSSFHELEDSLSLAHYRMTKVYKSSVNSNIDIEEKLKRILS